MPKPSHSEHVLQQLNNQREWGFLCDCCIAIGDIYFRAHKAVLAACSSYFRMMFIKDQQVMARLNLSNMQISAECFDLILQLMYLGRIVVGPYEFDELKAAMIYLQMYYIPESLEDLKDIRSTTLTPSSSSSSSSTSSSSSSSSSTLPPIKSKMMFGVRMYEQQRHSHAEGERLQPATSSTSTMQSNASAGSRPADDMAVNHVLPVVDLVSDQPCDLRKKPSGRSSSVKERPRFGRTYTCDDCGFVFSCEKLLIEHILTCTNRKAFQTPKINAGADNDGSKTESSASEASEDQSDVCKMDCDWADPKSDGEASKETVIKSVRAGVESKSKSSRNTIIIKIEPDEISPLGMDGIKVVQVGEHSVDRALTAGYEAAMKGPNIYDKDEDAGISVLEDSNSPFEGHMPSREDKGTLTKVSKIKDEGQGTVYLPCELCGILLTEEDQSSHYISSHMGHICACGKCGQILIKGRQLQEHAERCGETQDAETDSIGEDSLGGDKPGLDDSLLESEMGCEGDLAASYQVYKDACFAFRCPHCGLHFDNEKLVVEHMIKCPEQELFRSALLEDGERDHRRKHFCSICGKGFFQRCHLREHYTVHTKEKQFTCQTCGKQFLRERQLRLHNDMHKGMARYICPVCDQGTFLKHDHVRHMISHLSAGETICQVCFQIFPDNEQLEQHMDVHLYICGVCGEKFRLRKDMRSHYNSKHTKKL
ncbi:zinc finger and BTB domain-containing protein 1 [Amia ocellicauda]|uniref:zinc finger and BTB domain-containing protein 1 n=1 Tax=Amia ocellicauda TaxID=2972642 RepID=UPI003464349F|nr:ZBTB1 protein [Amia calva]